MSTVSEDHKDQKEQKIQSLGNDSKKELDSQDDSNTIDEAANPISRKRTRDDFEDDNDQIDNSEDNKQGKNAPLKRKRSLHEKNEEKKDGDNESSNDNKNDDIDKQDNDVLKESQEKDNTTTETESQGTKSQDESEIESKDESNDDTKSKSREENKETITKPKFVFGSTTPFGANAFSIISKDKNVFSSSPKPSEKTTKPTPSVFGSNSKFGNAFQTAISKESIFDKKKDDKDDDKEESVEKEQSKSNHLYKQVDLEKKKVETGEEGEEQIFTCRAKLYALDLSNVKEGWKERGTGNVHVNKSKDSNQKSRIIMRSTGLLKVILNTSLSKGLEVVKGMPSSLSSEKFIRITSVENGKPFQYAVKTGNVDTTDSLYESVTSLIPKEASDLV